MPSAKPESIDWVMRSSPTRLMMSSTFSVATRMDPDSAAAFCTGAPAAGPRSTSAWGTALVSAGALAAAAGAACTAAWGEAGAAQPVGVEFKPAIRIHPVEYLVELGARNLTLHVEGPRQIASLRIERVEGGQSRNVGVRRKLPQPFEFREHAGRLVAQSQELGDGLEGDAPARSAPSAAAGGTARRTRGRRLRLIEAVRRGFE